MKKVALCLRRQRSTIGDIFRKNSKFRFSEFYMIGLVLILFSLIWISDNTQAADCINTELKIGSEVRLLAAVQSYFSRRKGVDSLVGTIHTPAFAIHVDYGAYSASLTIPAEQKQSTKKAVMIDGLSATILVYQKPANQQHHKGSWFVGVNFSNVRDSVIGSIRLTMYAWLQNEKQVELVERMFKSIRFGH